MEYMGTKVWMLKKEKKRKKKSSEKKLKIYQSDSRHQNKSALHSDFSLSQLQTEAQSHPFSIFFPFRLQAMKYCQLCEHKNIQCNCYYKRNSKNSEINLFHSKSHCINWTHAQTLNSYPNPHPAIHTCL